MRNEASLRAWAKGRHPTEAATELLIRGFGGRFAHQGNPWILASNGNIWVNFEEIPDNLGGLSGGERRLLLVAASIADVEVSVVLGDVIPGLDRKVLELVMAAIAHAGGSHERSDFSINADAAASFEQLPSLYPWPDES